MRRRLVWGTRGTLNVIFFHVYIYIPTGKGHKLAKNSLPTLGMPKKSIVTKPLVPRKEPVRLQEMYILLMCYFQQKN